MFIGVLMCKLLAIYLLILADTDVTPRSPNQYQSPLEAGFFI